MKVIFIPSIFLLFLLTNCSDQSFIEENVDLNLKFLASINDVFEAGEVLMSIPEGLNDLESQDINQEIMFIGVHGKSSRGYEWIYPLQKINAKNNLVSFFKWNDNICVTHSINLLNKLILDRLKHYENIKKVVLFGHSYGGLLAVSFMNQWEGQLPLEVHAIAAPLNIKRSSLKNCDFLIPKIVPNNSHLYEWRTIQSLDGVFKNMEFDPQNIQILGSRVKRLPEKYKEYKLGHNWSLSWVADQTVTKEN